MNNKIIVKALKTLKRKPLISGVNWDFIPMIISRFTLSKEPEVFKKYVDSLKNEFVTAKTNKIIKNINPFFEEVEIFLSKINIDDRFPQRNTGVIAKRNAYNSIIKDILMAYKAYVERADFIAYKRIVKVLKTTKDIELTEALVVTNFLERLTKLNENMEAKSDEN